MEFTPRVDCIFMSEQPGFGRINKLVVTDINSDGIRLDCSNLDEKGTGDWSFEYVVLPKQQSLESINPGDEIDVFLYLDSKDELVATTEEPTIQVGECAYLRVLTTGQYGAFVDWGLAKDLLLPHSEQAYPVRPNSSYVVYAYLDESTGRVACSTMLHHFLEEEASSWLKNGQQVNLLIAAKSELGFKAVIDGHSLGLIFHDQLSQPLKFGDRMKGWIKNIREDGLIDLSTNTLDDKTRSALSEQVLRIIKESGGRLEISDRSSPEEVYRTFKVSKKNFKRAISGLYKQRLIRIEPNHIELI